MLLVVISVAFFSPVSVLSLVALPPALQGYLASRFSAAKILSFQDNEKRGLLCRGYASEVSCYENFLRDNHLLKLNHSNDLAMVVLSYVVLYETFNHENIKSRDLQEITFRKNLMNAYGLITKFEKESEVDYNYLKVFSLSAVENIYRIFLHSENNLKNVFESNLEILLASNIEYEHLLDSYIKLMKN